MWEFLIPMQPDVQSPDEFIRRLRTFQEAADDARGTIANQLSEKIIGKQVDLAAVRQQLLDSGQADLMDTLDRLIDLIEPYIEEGGVEE